MTLFTALIALAGSAFVSATLFPGASEVVLIATLSNFPESFWWIIAVASAANTAGSMTSYVIGRLFPKKENHQALAWLKNYGAFALLFAWLPVVGDALPLAAGWLRIHWLSALLFITLGKSLRYLTIAFGTVQVIAPNIG